MRGNKKIKSCINCGELIIFVKTIALMFFMFYTLFIEQGNKYAGLRC